jgi:hypothetical protein
MHLLGCCSLKIHQRLDYMLSKSVENSQSCSEEHKESEAVIGLEEPPTWWLLWLFSSLLFLCLCAIWRPY